MELDLLSVEKPARYMGAEMGIVVKPEAELRIALAFPDLYEVGMSHLGLRILYHILNAREGIAAERVFAPWPDMAAQLASRHKPLATLETDTPLFATDMIGFTLQYELSCTNIIKMLDQSGIPRRAALRDERWPLILGGGPGAYNPEPLAPFLMLFCWGTERRRCLKLQRSCAAGKNLLIVIKRNCCISLQPSKGSTSLPFSRCAITRMEVWHR